MGKAKNHHDGSSDTATDNADDRRTSEGTLATADDADEAAGNTNTTKDANENLDESDDDDDDDDGDDGVTSGSSRRTTSTANDNATKKRSSERPPPRTITSATAKPPCRPSLRRHHSSASASASASGGGFQKSCRDLGQHLRRRSSRSYATLKRQSSALFENVHRNYLPSTPSGWALLTLSAASVGLQYELHVQKELTAPPIVFCQNSGASSSSSDDGDRGGNGNGRSVLNRRMDRIFEKLSGRGGRGGGGGEREGILSRAVTPSLFIGTRGVVSSTAAYALGDGSSNRRVERAREVMRMGADGALIVLDWEIPLTSADDENASPRRQQQQQQQQQQQSAEDIKRANSIDRPVVLLVHGMNNDSTFGYVRSMMRTATERGWIAVCMNLRGQDGEHQVKNNTPRGYNAGYTGDLRGVVQQLERRLKKREPTGAGRRNRAAADDNDDDDPYAGGPLFLLGYSLGANIVTKYLGEESLHGTLPKCIGGGAAMGNPLHIHSGTIPFPWNVVLGAGVKRSILSNFRNFQRHHEPGFQRAMKRALLSPTIGRLDDAAAPYLVRNDPHPPYATRIGFEDGEEYWRDASSHRHVAHVSVPLLKITARDDFLVFGQFARKLNHCLENPNVMVVKTRCGGHLGWQESPPVDSKGRKKGGSSSWSDAAVADFIEALLQVREEDRRMRLSERGESSPPPVPKVLSRL